MLLIAIRRKTNYARSGSISFLSFFLLVFVIHRYSVDQRVLLDCLLHIRKGICIVYGESYFIAYIAVLKQMIFSSS